MKNVIAMSTICADVFDRTGEVRLGGEALNFAMNILDFPNINVGLLGAVGDDEPGIKAIECITQKGIDKSCVHVIKDGKTAAKTLTHFGGF
jgi:fructoselysine 6-kinase